MPFEWSDVIGDPDPIGWFIVFSYFVAVIFSYKSYRLSMSGGLALSRERKFWLFITVILVALGLNKQLDLQVLVTEIGRAAAQRQGWYDHRRVVQLIFIIVIAMLSVVSVIVIKMKLSRPVGSIKLAILGIIFLLSFIVIRASSFHRVDEYLGIQLVNLPLNWIIELFGIFLIAASSLWYNRSRKGGKTRRDV